MDPCQRRLTKELSQLITEPPVGVRVKSDMAMSADLRVWTVVIDGALNTLYEGEKFTLQFKFDEQYPFTSPEVMFIGSNIPIHPHVYSNGHICLSILTDDWTPALSVQSVCLSILSMLSSCKEKKRPADNAFYVRTCNKSPNKTRWWFHDMTLELSSTEADDAPADRLCPSATVARGNVGDRPKSVELVFVPKTVRLTTELPTLDAEFLAWKKNFWRQRIGAIKHVVAPMVDQSELAFRMLLRERGAADLCFTPMVHANLFISDATYRRGAFSTLQAANEEFDGPTDRPLIVQFCANDPRILLDACRLVEGYCDGVDLNLGCPQLIAKRGRYGSFLQEFPDLVAEMVRTVHAYCRLPLSVKIRALVDVDATVVYARKLVDAGAAMITVHGRVREQRGVHTGLADWRHIAAVKRAIDVPVIANGNIQLYGDVAHCLRVTGADAVMSAEGILNNPLLFTGRNVISFDVARDYLSYATRYKAHLSAIRAHIFHICHHSLLLHDDLRAKTSYVFKIAEFRAIVDELEQRALVAANLVSAEWLALDAAAQGHLAGQSLPDNWAETLYVSPSALEEAGPATTEDSKSSESMCLQQPKRNDTLLNLVNMMPAWVCKPYVRPSRPIVALQSSNESGVDAPAGNNAGEIADRPVSAYRAARRAEISRLVAETGLSRRKLRKNERRQKEVKRKAHGLHLHAQAAVEEDGEEEEEDGEEEFLKKRKYSPCECCALPAGVNCELQLCKRCCKFTCVRMARDCKVHGFSHEKMHEKRVQYAQRMGISLEDLLKKETQDFERQKFLKNMKKTPLEYSAMHRDEAERRAKSAVNEPNDQVGRTESNMAE